jgi:hypothetical protein
VTVRRRGVWQGMKDTAYAVMHPRETVVGAVHLATDGVYTLTDRAFNVSSSNSRSRRSNYARFWKEFKQEFRSASPLERTGMLTEFGGSLFSPGVGAAVGVVVKGARVGAMASRVGSSTDNSLRQIRSIEKVSSDVVNQPFMTPSAIATGWNPPYPTGLNLRKITLDQEMKFYRVHTNRNDPVGRFMAWEREISPYLNKPQALKQHLGLPDVPIYITEVNVPTGTSVIVGLGHNRLLV